MSNLNVQQRKFVVKAGMTPQDVINSKEATAQQKKLAYVFDSDDVSGYSQREADVFNATIITDRGKNGISLWTRYQDGSKKETQYNGNLDEFKYSPKGDVKPYIIQINNKGTEVCQSEQCNSHTHSDNFKVGTTINNACESNCIEQFYLADLDGDGKLSEKEIAVWTKPTIEFNRYEKAYNIENRPYAKTFFYAGMTVSDIESPCVYHRGRHWGSRVYKKTFPKLQAYLQKKFKEFDTNGDNVLSETEIKNACKNPKVLKQSDGHGGSPMIGHKFDNGYHEKYELIQMYNAYVSKHPVIAFFRGL